MCSDIHLTLRHLMSPSDSTKTSWAVHSMKQTMPVLCPMHLTLSPYNTQRVWRPSLPLSPPLFPPTSGTAHIKASPILHPQGGVTREGQGTVELVSWRRLLDQFLYSVLKSSVDHLQSVASHAADAGMMYFHINRTQQIESLHASVTDPFVQTMNKVLSVSCVCYF